jgi:hypothetical protein
MQEVRRPLLTKAGSVKREPMKPKRRAVDRLAVVLWTAIIVGLLFFAFPGELVKKTGNVFLVIPDALGIIHRAAPSEITATRLAWGYPVTVSLRSGNYLIFTGDIRMLAMSIVLQSNAEIQPINWMTIRKADEGGEEVPLSPVMRGLRPYDSAIADGRPIVRFNIAEKGNYEFFNEMSGSNIRVHLVPDYVTGKEPVLLLLFLAQAALVISPVYGIHLIRTRKARALRRRAFKEQRRKADELVALSLNHRKADKYLQQ